MPGSGRIDRHQNGLPISDLLKQTCPPAPGLLLSGVAVIAMIAVPQSASAPQQVSAGRGTSLFRRTGALVTRLCGKLVILLQVWFCWVG
jgi:hypothetical protein